CVATFPIAQTARLIAVTVFCSSMPCPPPRSTLFPYTTLFRSSCRTPSGLPVQVQLLGGDPDKLAQAAQVAVEAGARAIDLNFGRSEEHTSELQSRFDLVCRLLLEKKKASHPGPYRDAVATTGR